ncbi:MULTISPECIES: STAS domain-containing protein [Cyanophyceae]|uniref:STAS domain-containing protein n=1 Tax=Cyanophyceae TaxID=3028117 RepID=UPI00016DC9FE|nr:MULTISPECIES: STAS domain-containing protein [Cyanophyceae]ACA99285.1 anti-anti-sigma factor [Picosynechococcus sp. PCC 7002]SMH32844.1 anti-anti-sigma factor [Picosynechococcus sp. OG1]SMQ84312.1 anti-anti-sigma factor [Synechococcus sp. 7002]
MDNKIAVFHPTGIFDNIKSLEFKDDLLKSIIEEKKEVVVLDFAGITFMDSAGLGSLVLLLKTVRSHGAKMILCNVNEQVQMLFELTNMNRVFEIFATQADFFEQQAAQS